MTNDKLADEIERYLAPDAIYHHWEPSMEDMEQIIAALRSELPQSGEMVLWECQAMTKCKSWCGDRACSPYVALLRRWHRSATQNDVPDLTILTFETAQLLAAAEAEVFEDRKPHPGRWPRGEG